MNFPREPWTGRLPGAGTPVQGQKRSPALSADPTLKRKRAKAQCGFTDSTWYAWYLVCESFDQSEKDLASLCLVSKAMNDLATSFLYRSLNIGMSDNLVGGFSGGLACRLLDTSRDSPRCFVQNITIVHRTWYGWERNENKHPISKLIESLPNLRCVKLNVPYDTTDNCLTCIDKHPRKPELHLLQENGEHLRSHSLPRVTLIKVRRQTNSYANIYAPPLKIHHFLNFITSCPNLKSCSWVVRSHEASNGQTPSDFEGFGIPKPLPSLEHLALDGYYLGSAMWHDWEADFNWSSLSSLEVGGLFALENIKLMTGRLANLKHFKVIGSDVQNEELCRSLEQFLVLFDTLVDLEILNCFVPLHVIARHTRLVNLCVHIGDTWNCLDSRIVFSNDDLISLEAMCPQLENLELDIERENGKNEWPQAILDTLARGFSNLKTLALHSRIGNLARNHSGHLLLYGDCHFFEPELTYKTAKELGSNFFATRQREFNPSSESTGIIRGFDRLQKLTLKKGLNKGLPCPTRLTEYSYKLNTLTFDILPPRTTGEAPELVHLERENQEKKCQTFSHTAATFHLELITVIAEEGSRFAPRRNPRASKVVTKLWRRVSPRRSERLARRRAMESVD